MIDNKLTDEKLRQRAELLRSQYTGSFETLHYVYDADVIDELLSTRAELRESRQPRGKPAAYMVGSALLENMTQAIAYKADSPRAIQPLYLSSQIAITRYQWREIGESDWQDCDKATYEYCDAKPELDTRIINIHSPVAALDPAVLINKFYERYPLNTFKSDGERAEALGYFMAGAELQCYGEFIAYEGGNGDE